MFILNQVQSIANHYLAEIRDVRLQKNRLVFRKNIERLGEILAYEVSKSLEYEETEVQTPLGKATVSLLKAQPVIVPVLRAGIPFYQGVLNFFNDADSGFIGAYRVPHDRGEEVQVNMDYIAVPSLEKKVIILVDPMLASGKSIAKTIKDMLKFGVPSHIHVICAIAAPEGIAYLKQELKVSYSLWTGAVDEKLDDMAYIVPGLGDAGDLSFGEKL